MNKQFRTFGSQCGLHMSGRVSTVKQFPRYPSFLKNANGWIIARLGPNALKLMIRNGSAYKGTFKWMTEIENSGVRILFWNL